MAASGAGRAPCWDPFTAALPKGSRRQPCRKRKRCSKRLAKRDGFVTVSASRLLRALVDVSPSGDTGEPTPLCCTLNIARYSLHRVLLPGWLGAIRTLSIHQLARTPTGFHRTPPVTYFGLPMIGFMGNNYVNGTLPGPSGPVLSNYSATSSHRWLLRIE
jgi:hypothetical protein